MTGILTDARCLLAAVVLLTLQAAETAGQAAHGGLAGVVRDTSGAVVPGVAVVIVDPARQVVERVATDATGFFRIDHLLPGRYEVRAEVSGFRSAVVGDVAIDVGTQARLDLRLEPGQVSEVVRVTASAPLKVDRADVATVIESDALTQLPLVDRNFTRIVSFTPGALRFVWQHASAENPQGSVQTQINGQPFWATGYQLDGAENREAILGVVVINPPIDAVEEVRVISQNYDAEFGQATAGIISVQTKSGTNQLHGTASEFYQSDRFQARNPFSQFQADPVTGRFVPESRRHLFGAALGGPIARDRWFAFGAYQGRRQTQGGSRLLSVPTEAARRGDLSAYGTPIFDPETGQPFVGGVIPAARLSPQAQNLLARVPLPNAPGRDAGTRDNFVASGHERLVEDSYHVRLDGHLTPGARTFGRYSLARYHVDGAAAFGEAGGPELVGLGGVSRVRNQNLVLGLNQSYGPTTLMDVRFGWFRYQVDVLPVDFGTMPAADAGIPGLNLDQAFTSGMPALFIDGDRGFRMGSGLEVNRCNCPLDQDERQWQMAANVTRIVGRHSFKIGADIRRAINLRVPSDRHRSGELFFSPGRTASPSLGGGLGLATFLIGDVTRFSRYVSTTTNAREQQWRQAYYAQDSWRATSRLTLSLGVRLDLIHPQTVNEPGNGGWLDVRTGDMLVGGVGGTDAGGNVRNRLNWAPRFGVTHTVGEKTVVRAGFGRTFELGILFGQTITQNLPVLQVQELNATSDLARVFTLAQGPPPPASVEVPATGRFPLPPGVFAFALAPVQQPPTVDAWNVSVEHQVTATSTAEVAYVANRGVHMFAGWTLDEPVNQPAIDGFLAGVPRDERRPFFAGGVRPNVLGLGGSYGWTQDISYSSNPATSAYRSLQARFTWRFAAGTSVQANYVLQRIEQEQDDYWIYDPALNRGPADFDRTHVFNLLTVVRLTCGSGGRGESAWQRLARAVVGEWHVSALWTSQSGLPFNVTYRDAFQDRDTGPNRPDLTGDPAGPRTRTHWFNATALGSDGSAFARPAPGTFGTLPYNALRGPGFHQVDVALVKQATVRGHHQIEFRLEAINALNLVNLGQPDGEIGVPGNPNPNAGRISSTAYNGTVPQRNLQFAVRYRF